MNRLTEQLHDGMSYTEGLWHIMNKITKGIVKAGFELYDVFVYYPVAGRTVRLTHDRRGERIRSETKAFEVRYEALTRITNHTFDPLDYRKEQPHALGNAITAWYGKKCSGYAPKTQKDYRLRIKSIIIPYFDDLDVRDINGKVLSDFLHHLRQSRNPKTVNNIMTILRAFLKDLHYEQTIKAMPVFPRALAIQSKERSWCTDDVLAAIVKDLDSVTKEAILTARLQWLRVGEVRALRWEDIDFEHHTLIVRSSFSDNDFRETTKTGKQQPIHLHSDVADMLAPRRGHGKAYVFTYRGRPLKEGYLRKQFNRARDAAGYPATLSLYGATRHSGATQGIIATGNIHAVSKGLRHGTVGQTMRYIHYADTRCVIEPAKEIARISHGLTNERKNSNDKSGT